MALSMIYDWRFANDIPFEKADFVAIGSGMLHGPHWVWSAAAVLECGGRMPAPVRQSVSLRMAGSAMVVPLGNEKGSGGI